MGRPQRPPAFVGKPPGWYDEAGKRTPDARTERGGRVEKKPTRSGLLEALFNQPWQPPETEEEAPKKKRPWVSNRVECPHCGSLMPVGQDCPGCGLHYDDTHPY